MNFNRRIDCCAIRVALAMLDGLGTPFSRSCAEKLRANSFKEYLESSLDPSKYDNWKLFGSDYAALHILSKFPNFAMDVDRKAVALDKFVQSERSCSDTYYRIRQLRSGSLSIGSPIHAIFHSARCKISGLLGPFNWDRAEQSFGFGPGACIGLGRRKGDSYYKFGYLKPTSTEGNAVLAATAISRIPRWHSHLSGTSGASPITDSIEIVKGNRITTVPKSAKTDRVIAIEPMLNMFIQKGIGDCIRRKLKKVKIDLDDQRPNQRLAYLGSLDGSLATIDLASASDTVSLSLVEDLLPPDWTEAIKLCRSPYGTLPDGTDVLYRKVSSMGNGFTFELESLIFWALATSVMSYLNEQDRRHAVYGDDIIVPVGSARLLIEVLAFAGFKTNEDKTFIEGPFRESCGKHFFLGSDVTPLYIRDDVRTIERQVWLANSISRLAYRLNGSYYGRDSRLLHAYGEAINQLPRKFKQPRVPLFVRKDEEGPDSWLAGDFDECRPKRAPNGLDSYQVKVLTRRYSSRSGHGIPNLIKALYYSQRKDKGVDSLVPFSARGGSSPGHKLARRVNSLTGVRPGVDLDKIPLSRFEYREIVTLCPQWEDAGPWMV